MNIVSLTGRLTKDPELRKTSNGVSICSFNLAVNRDYKQENQPDADFIQCQAWSNTADNMCRYLSKGSLIALKGRIQTRSYEDNKGQKHYVTEVVAERVEFLETKKKENSDSNNEYTSYQESQEMTNEERYQRDLERSLNINDDVLPF